ncbi:MAG TPA: hypothetical protein VGK32_19890 [Vicinamibacterales bacterium]
MIPRRCAAEALQFVRVFGLERFEHVVQLHLNVVGLRRLAQVLPPRRFRNHERGDATILVGIVDGLLVAVVVALLVCDERLDLCAPAVVPYRKETREDDRQDVALVVGRFDRAAERNRRLEELLGERDDAAVLAVSRLFGFLRSRLALCRGL